MARLLVVLICFALASAANYGDYTEMKMPMYGEYDGEARASRPYADDEYREHPSDTTVDYSYEEEKIPPSDIATDNEEHNIQSTRKSRRLMKPETDDDEYAIDNEVHRNSNRHSRHRPRSKVKDLEEMEERLETDEQQPFDRRLVKTKRRRDQGAFSVDNIDKTDDLYSNLEDIKHRITYTNKEDKLHFKNYEDDSKNVQRNPKVRRKTNKYGMNRSEKDFGENREEESLTISRERPEHRDREDVEYSRMENDNTRRRLVHNNYRPYDVDIKIRGDETYDIDHTNTDSQQKASRTPGDVYNDNYDIDKINNNQKKNPLPRRTTTERPRVESWPTIATGETWSRRLVPELLKQISTNHTTTVTMVLSTTNSTPLITISTTVTTTTPSTTTTKLSDEELSIAEKSRLSIMKKAARKDGEMSITTKPPVLLQVTEKRHTLVMIEPPSKIPVRSRVRIVSQDTPERLDKVKRLMRHKLVNQVKSIEELTDKWDEMVCDYVDMALLDDAFRMSPSALPVVVLLFYFI